MTWREFRCRGVMLRVVWRDGASLLVQGEVEEGRVVMSEADTDGVTRILVPFDGTPQAESAIPYAAALAAPGTTIVFCTVYPEDTDGSGATDSAIDARLNILSQELQAAGRTIEAKTYYGDPAAKIVEAAANGGADLIVMASHGRGVMGRLLHGSVADRVAREATVPVMVVRAAQQQAGPVGIARLVLPLDGSPLAEQSIPVATAIARQFAIPLFLVRAVNIAELMPPAIGMGEAIPFQIYDETEEEMNKEASTYLDAEAGKLRQEGFTVTTKLLAGPAASAISEMTRPGDVVVLCSHERSGFTRWLMGSVAEQLVRDDDCPVILVPGHEHGEPAGLTA
jgi:nucleotide-binding universal stress UspA family protein